MVVEGSEYVCWHPLRIASIIYQYVSLYKSSRQILEYKRLHPVVPHRLSFSCTRTIRNEGNKYGAQMRSAEVTQGLVATCLNEK